MSLTRKINALLSLFGLQLMQKSLLYDWQTGDNTRNHQLRLADGAAEYLTIDNSRLLELRADYSRFQGKVSLPLVWTDAYVKSYDLQSFRGDNCYVWQTRDRNCDEINYCLTTYYVKYLDTFGFLQRNIEDGLFGIHTYTVDGTTISRDLLDSIIELIFLEKNLELSRFPELTVLDIGAGYGRLAHRAACSLPNLKRYLCTDAVPESTFLSEYHIRFRQLEDRVSVVPLDRIVERLQQQPIDLAVNIHSFSECSLDAIEWWLSLLAGNSVRYLFIVPNVGNHGGEKLALNDGTDFSFLLDKYRYQLLCRAPKYLDPLMQRYGVSPTFHYLFQLAE